MSLGYDLYFSGMRLSPISFFFFLNALMNGLANCRGLSFIGECLLGRAHALGTRYTYFGLFMGLELWFIAVVNILRVCISAYCELRFLNFNNEEGITCMCIVYRYSSLLGYN